MGLTLRSSLTQVLPIEDVTQVGDARRRAQKLACQHGFGESDAGRVALLATELASNLLKHAERGELHVRALPRREGRVAIELLTLDRGKGFDRDTCQVDGYSTGGTQGIGLGALERMAEVFDVYADARGAAVLARVHACDDRLPDLRIGVSQHSLHDDPACGDAWQIALRENGFSAVVIDGLGHGPEAEAAALAGISVFEHSAHGDPLQLIADMHQSMLGSRGGAVGIAQYERAADALKFAGIGNIGASLIQGGRSRGIASLPGIVGGQYRVARAYDYAQQNADLLILYSDGLQSRWNLQDYPGLAHRHPALIAGVLHRDFCRGRDDVTVLVIDLESAHA